MSIVTILSILVSSMIVYAAPLIFTSIGGAYSEHAGVVNVGLEGIMVMGAFSGIIFNLTFEPELGSLTPWLSLIVAAGIGVLFSLIHAVATIHFRADHIVSGTVLNLMAPPLAVFLVKQCTTRGKLIISKLPLGKHRFRSYLKFRSLEIFSSTMPASLVGLRFSFHSLLGLSCSRRNLDCVFVQWGNTHKQQIHWESMYIECAT